MLNWLEVFLKLLAVVVVCVAMLVIVHFNDNTPDDSLFIEDDEFHQPQLRFFYGVITVYGVIYWTNNDNTLLIAQNKDGSVWTAETIEEADAKAYEIERNLKVECRTISLESVHA